MYIHKSRESALHSDVVLLYPNSTLQNTIRSYRPHCLLSRHPFVTHAHILHLPSTVNDPSFKYVTGNSTKTGVYATSMDNVSGTSSPVLECTSPSLEAQFGSYVGLHLPVTLEGLLITLNPPLQLVVHHFSCTTHLQPLQSTTSLVR